MMKGDRDQDQKEELFEDLDKFFAPIQDVEWPDLEEPAETIRVPDARESGDPAATPPLDEPEPPVEESTQFDTAELDMEQEAVVVRQDAESDDEGSPFRDEAAPVDEQAEMARAGESEPAQAGELEPAQAGESEPAQAEMMPAEAPPAGGPSTEIAPEGELAEATTASFDVAEEERALKPSMEAVERAAEHFAESVRAGTGFDPGSTGTGESSEPEDVPADHPSELPTEPEVTFKTQEGVEEAILADLEEPVAQRTVVVGTEGTTGPSWQEPASVEVGGEPEPRVGGRDVPAAFLTGIVLAAIALGSLAIDRGVFAVVASILVVIAMGEFYSVLHRRHLQPATAIGLVTGGLVLAGAYFHGEQAMVAMVALGTLASFVWFMAVPAPHRKNITVSIALTMLPVVAVALLAGYALITVTLPEPFDGPALVLAVIGLTFVYDTAAFAIGSVWGSRPFAQAISPKKSWEGAIGATLVVVIVAIGLVAAVVEPLESIGTALGLAVVVAVFAPLGDLAESLLKRDLDVKDMGSVLPGHGGVLDRIDSLLFVAPAAFLYFRIFL